MGDEDRYQGCRAGQVTGIVRVGYPTDDGSGGNGRDEVERRHLGQGATFTDAEAGHGGSVEQQGLDHDPPQGVRGSKHHHAACGTHPSARQTPYGGRATTQRPAGSIGHTSTLLGTRHVGTPLHQSSPFELVDGPARCVRAARATAVGPLVSARRQGGTPSISIWREKLRNVLIKTINPRTVTLWRVGETATVRIRSAATKISSPSSRTAPNVSRQAWYPRRAPAARHVRAATMSDHANPRISTATPNASKPCATSLITSV